MEVLCDFDIFDLACYRELAKIDSESAEASRVEDEVKVKELIRASVGFAEVNKFVKVAFLCECPKTAVQTCLFIILRLFRLCCVCAVCYR